MATKYCLQTSSSSTAFRFPNDDILTEEDPLILTDADVAFANHRTSLEQLTARLRHMPIASLFVGGKQYFLGIILVILAGVAVQWRRHSVDLDFKGLGIYAGGLLGAYLIAVLILRVIATRQVRAVHTPIRHELFLARAATQQQLINATEKRRADVVAAQTARNTEVQSAKDQVSPVLAKATQTRTTGIAAVQAESAQNLARIDSIRDGAKSETDEWLRRQLHDLSHLREKQLKENKLATSARSQEIETRYQQRKTELEARWSSGLELIQAPIDRDGEGVPTADDWSDSSWEGWKPSKKFASRVRFGQMQVNLKQIADNVPQLLKLPETFPLPAVLAFPAQASLLIHSDQAGRPEALRTLQMVMARLLTSLPAGRVRFTIIDPVGLGQNFAGFMHLADYDDALVGGRIWTSQDQIDAKLANLAEHMETVIQKYLRNEFETIDDYNRQAGELAEPYRFLVIADLPTNFQCRSLPKIKQYRLQRRAMRRLHTDHA